MTDIPQEKKFKNDNRVFKDDNNDPSEMNKLDQPVVVQANCIKTNTANERQNIFDNDGYRDKLHTK